MLNLLARVSGFVVCLAALVLILVGMGVGHGLIDGEGTPAGMGTVLGGLAGVLAAALCLGAVAAILDMQRSLHILAEIAVRQKS